MACNGIILAGGARRPGDCPAFAAGLRTLMTDIAYRELLGSASRDYCAVHSSRRNLL